MKKIIILMLAIFLGFSINGFSQDKTHKTIQKAKTEQSRKGNAKARHKPRKKVSRKRVHKSGPKKHSQSKVGIGIM